jgi:phosphatidylserine synthase
MDPLDCKVARLTNTIIAFDVELDDIPGMVSFAIASVFFAYTWGIFSIRKLERVEAFIYIVAIDLLFARFNTPIDTMRY